MEVLKDLFEIIKKRKLIIILVIIIIFLWSYSSHIRYIFSNKDNSMISDDLGFVFYLETKERDWNSYSTYSTYDAFKDKTSQTFYIPIADRYLDNDDIRITIGGTFYNYPSTPVIKINGKKTDDVSITKQDGGDIFKFIYCIYSFRVNYEDRIISDQVYDIYVRCGYESQTFHVIFTASSTFN